MGAEINFYVTTLTLEISRSNPAMTLNCEVLSYRFEVLIF